MFKKTKTNTQLGIFSSPHSLLSGKAEIFYENREAWHNIFYREITQRIEETLCSPLFVAGIGAPNSPVRVLIGMMVLKEGHGWSDAQLFEQCRYNLLVRRALGLMNMDEAVPTESTYYLFRKRIVEHERKTGVNLFAKTFSEVTKGQAMDFEVSGKSVRMDSKLMGSNIAWLSRYELIHETLRLFLQDVKGKVMGLPLGDPEKKLVEELQKERGDKVVYRNSSEEVKKKMESLGILCSKLLALYTSASSVHYATMRKVFSEQFTEDEHKTILPRSKETISAQSVQSPHDTDCHYRNKDGNQVKGYSINLTESCDSGKLNLIGAVDVCPVSAADNDFLPGSIQQAQAVFADTIERVHADGAYHSPENQLLCEKENIDLCIAAIQGSKGRFDLFPGENNTLTVIDTRTNQTLEAKKIEHQDKWSVKIQKAYRYFTSKEITTSLLRRKIAGTDQKILNVRNNVEATIFQLGFHYSNDKSRYRGLIKHKMWANMRCLWVNFVRIIKFIGKKPLPSLFSILFHLFKWFIGHIEACFFKPAYFFVKIMSSVPNIQKSYAF